MMEDVIKNKYFCKWEEAHDFNIIKNSNGYYLLDNAIPHIVYDKDGNICDIKTIPLK